MRRAAAVFLIGCAVVWAALAAPASSKLDPRMKGAFRRAPEQGWTYVYLEGSPAEIGYQHGYLLAPEIQDLQKVFALELAHDDAKDWKFYRHAAQNILWPHVEQEYREEMQGIAEGVHARGVKLDLWDIVAMNAAM